MDQKLIKSQYTVSPHFSSSSLINCKFIYLFLVLCALDYTDIHGTLVNEPSFLKCTLPDLSINVTIFTRI